MYQKLKIGANLSVSGGYTKMIETANSINANVVQCFIRNPRSGEMRTVNEADEKAAADLLRKYGIENSSLIAHAPYTMNPCSAKPEVREFTAKLMREDFEYLERLPGVIYNFHPGAHTGQGAERGIELTSQILAETMWRGMKTKVTIETMAGKGTEIGKNFEEIRKMIDLVEEKNQKIKGMIGVCLDTCHVHDAGYDIINDLDGVLDQFDSVIGLSRLAAIHLNDSKNPIASHKDRHEVIGGGYIGLPAMINIINNKRLSDVPFCLETPNEIEGYKAEIELLQSYYQNKE